MAFTSTSFPAELVREVFIGAKGKSSIAKLCGQTPVAFSGTDVMVFSLDGEVNLVAEGGAKAKHTNSNDVAPITPVKIEYGARVSNEFLKCSYEKQLEYIRGFKDGFAGKLARGLDIMVMHGINPATGTAAGVGPYARRLGHGGRPLERAGCAAARGDGRIQPTLYEPALRRRVDAAATTVLQDPSLSLVHHRCRHTACAGGYGAGCA